MTSDGQARVDVAPTGDSNDNTVLQNFANAVQTVAPNATEGPISILEARRAVVGAFLEAGACALISIAILLWITLRRLSDVLLTLVPLFLAGVVTLEICVLVDLPLNFANIIACRCCSASAWPSKSTTSWRGVKGRPICCNRCSPAR